jgi:hypothetical protein
VATGRIFAALVIVAGIPGWTGVAAAQSSAGATVATGETRPMGRPFSGRLSATTSRDAPPAAQVGMLYAVLDGKGKLAINGTFQQLTSPATAAYFHRGADGQRGPRVATLMVTKGATGVIKGDVMLTADDIAELQKGVYYVEIATEKAADGEVRGWLLSGMLK